MGIHIARRGTANLTPPMAEGDHDRFVVAFDRLPDEYATIPPRVAS